MLHFLTASVNPLLVHAAVDSFLVLDPHSCNFIPFSSVYTKSKRDPHAAETAEEKEMGLSKRRTHEDADGQLSEPFSQQRQFASHEGATACMSSMMLRLMHTEARQATATAHEGATKLTLDKQYAHFLSASTVCVLLFYIPEQ